MIIKKMRNHISKDNDFSSTDNVDIGAKLAQQHISAINREKIIAP